MKRGFYSTLFAGEPAAVRTDCAKWMTEDTRVKFANPARGHQLADVDHLGIQVDDETVWQDVFQRLHAAQGPVLDQGAVTCCYHQLDKSWIADPSGLRWEALLTHGETVIRGDGGARPIQPAAA